MKKFIALLLAIVVVFALIGCKGKTTSQSGSGNKIRIAWINPLIGHPLYNMQDEGAKLGAEAYDVELAILGTPIISPEQYVQAVENALTDKYQGIVVCPYNPQSMIPILQRVKEAGIPVVFTIGDIPEQPGLRTTLLGLDFVEFGSFQAEAISTAVNGKGNVVWMQTNFEGLQNDFREGFEEKLKDYPNMRLVISDYDNADMLLAVQKFQDIFMAYPEVDAVVACDVAAGSAAARVAKEMNRNIKVLAIDDIPETLDQIRSGDIWGTVAQNYVGMGYESVRLLVEALGGERVPQFKQVPLLLVTKSNIDSYKEELLKQTKTKGIPW